jgi:hypothetical protein
MSDYKLISPIAKLISISNLLQKDFVGSGDGNWFNAEETVLTPPVGEVWVCHGGTFLREHLESTGSTGTNSGITFNDGVAVDGSNVLGKDTRSTSHDLRKTTIEEGFVASHDLPCTVYFAFQDNDASPEDIGFEAGAILLLAIDRYITDPEHVAM